jgi:hypothetical protein
MKPFGLWYSILMLVLVVGGLLVAVVDGHLWGLLFVASAGLSGFGAYRSRRRA